MGAVGLDRIAEFAPERVINVGITEQNMMSVASGLALSGHRVFVYGIISHIIFRAFEQIKLDICVQNLPIVIIGVGAGLAYGVDGPTHHGTEDVAALRALPNMTIYNPSDCAIAKECVILAYQNASPGFVRMDKENVPDILPAVAFGKSIQCGYRIVGNLGNGLIAATGMTTWAALRAQEILESKSVSCAVIDVHRLSPLGLEEISRHDSPVEWLCVVEEAVTNGGLADLFARALVGKKLKFFSAKNIGNRFLLGSARREWVWKTYELDGLSLANSILRALQKT